MLAVSRRNLLTDVGRGMLVAGLGTTVAGNQGFSTAFAERGPDSLKLGPFEGLVERIRSTPPDIASPVADHRLAPPSTLPTPDGSAPSFASGLLTRQTQGQAEAVNARGDRRDHLDWERRPATRRVVAPTAAVALAERAFYVGTQLPNITVRVVKNRRWKAGCVRRCFVTLKSHRQNCM